MHTLLSRDSLGSKLRLGLLCLLLFLIPTNLFIKFFENEAYVRGLLVDYLLPKFYLSDLPALGLIGLWLFELLKKPHSLKTIFTTKPTLSFFFLAFLALLGIRQFFSPYPLASIWMFVKLIEMGLLAASLVSVKVLHKHLAVFMTLITTIVFQSSVGLYQFITQQSVGGYVFLGEVNVAVATQLAKVSWFGVEKILPYGTTAHPNVLGGVLAVFLLLALQLYLSEKSPQKMWALVIASVIGLPTLFLTFSITAWSVLAIGITLLFLPTAVKSLLQENTLLILFTFFIISLGTVIIGNTFFPTSASFFRRHNLQQAAFESIKNQPWLGSGLNTNAATLEPFIAKEEVVRFVQPVHNAVLVWLSETGILGLCLVITLWQLGKTHKWRFPVAMLILLPALCFDHYVLTLQTGLVVTVLLTSSVTRFLHFNPQTPI